MPGVGGSSPAVCVEKDIQRRAEVVRSSGVPGSSGRAVVRATHVLSGQHPGRRRPQHWLGGSEPWVERSRHVVDLQHQTR